MPLLGNKDKTKSVSRFHPLEKLKKRFQWLQSILVFRSQSERASPFLAVGRLGRVGVGPFFGFLGVWMTFALEARFKGKKQRCKRWVSVHLLQIHRPIFRIPYSHVLLSYYSMLLGWMVGSINKILALRMPKVMRGGGRPGRGFHRIKSVLGTSAAVHERWRPGHVFKPRLPRLPSNSQLIAIETRWSKWEQRAMETAEALVYMIYLKGIQVQEGNNVFLLLIDIIMMFCKWIPI